MAEHLIVKYFSQIYLNSQLVALMKSGNSERYSSLRHTMLCHAIKMKRHVLERFKEAFRQTHPTACGAVDPLWVFLEASDDVRTRDYNWTQMYPVPLNLDDLDPNELEGILSL